ncbi:MAG: lysylphosphatidylglycerol synthase transmembrane domain-containing protein [Bacteroidaceae bacterium]
MELQFSFFKKLIKYVAKILLPLAMATEILWWMYRDFAWDDFREALAHDMNWTWMWLSFPFGISAQVLRALRWKQVLAPMGEHPRRCTSSAAIFISYASSLVVPRVGEVLRCAILRRYDGVSFTRSVGSVVTERVIDMTMILLLSVATVLFQIPVFIRFCRQTGMSADSLLGQFTTTGYLVTALCFLGILLTGILLVRRFSVAMRTKGLLCDLRDGLLSVAKVDNPALFLAYSVGIWLSYFLHFYLTFFCFGFTAPLGITVALVAFVVGCFAVIVPTPNGAGPWHFAVKTVLVLYGVEATQAATYALIVHTLQTLLVAALGVYAVALLAVVRRKGIPETQNNQ